MAINSVKGKNATLNKCKYRVFKFVSIVGYAITYSASTCINNLLDLQM